MQLSSRKRLVVFVLAAVVLLALAGTAYFLWHRPSLPQQGNPLYEEYVEAFQVGTAALDSGSLNERAIEKLTEAINIIPQEPAAWANRGIAYLRLNDFKKAASDLQRAREMAPGNPQIEEALSYAAESQGNYSQAEAHARAALQVEPNNARLLYRLYAVLGKGKGDDASADRLRLLDDILKQRPTSLFTLAERAELAYRANDLPVLSDTLTRLERLSKGWHTWQAAVLYSAIWAWSSPRETIADCVLPLWLASSPIGPHNTRALLTALRKDGGPAKQPETFFQFQNLLKQETGYSREAQELNPTNTIGTTFQTFLRLPPPHSDPDPADQKLVLRKEQLALQAGIPKTLQEAPAVFPVWLSGQTKPAILVASATEVRRADALGLVLPFPSGEKKVPPSCDGVLAIDWTNDGLAGLVLAGAGGVRFYQQKADNGFEDVTAQTKLPKAILEGDYHGAWAADVDLDGDLDIILARRTGPPVLLRNNFDGTFTAKEIFAGVKDARCFAWLDLDHDGAADIALLDAQGRLHLFMNKRSGAFERRSVPDEKALFCALAVADVNDDGVLDLVALRRDGTLMRISDKDKGQAFDVAELAKLDRQLPLRPGEVRLIAVDLDNNGAIDFVLRTNQGGQVWLADGKGAFLALDMDVPAGTADIVSLDENGRHDILGYPKVADGQEGGLARWTTEGSRDYHWLNLRARALPKTSGDNRVNSFGLGSEIEVRSGTLVVKKPIDRAVVHIGLGTHKTVGVARIVWTNGGIQFEFDKESDILITVGQRLKGSCPFLFSWDGEKMVFVSDFCWSTPLGMYVNGQNKGGFPQTTDQIKIRGEQLKPRDGYYDLRVNANLWETHFLDHLALLVVDHPPNTEMHVDERFFLTPVPLQIHLSGPSKPVARAWDHKGNDVTAIVRDIDGNYLDHAGRGIYQGITRDHWVEVDLGEEAPKEGPVYLLAHGWIHPTDSSINLALEQGSLVRPQPLTLEVPDGEGGWKVGLGGIGFPAGKNKTCVIRLDGIAGKGVCRHFRLRTNMEIFWDALHYAVGLDAGQAKVQKRLPDKAELQFRGLLRMSQASPSAPELPHYDEVVCRTQYWRDLIGFYTRFGDVRELLAKIDDRYVIMNAGDEIRLRFKAPPSPPLGWKRDYVWVCDGWTKDGDVSTKHSKTVLPLPYHGMTNYDKAPGQLEDDPVYRRFPKDWEIYHTRHVTPHIFERGLLDFQRPGR